MFIFDLLQETISAISANKTRSGLTILGIVIGIGSVIAMISIGQGATGQIQASIEALGSNLLTVMPGAMRTGVMMASRGTAQTLKENDIEVLKPISGVISVVPVTQRVFQVVAPNGNNTRTNVIGASAEIFQVREISLESGSFFNDEQVRNISRVVVLGKNVAEDLFPEENSIGKIVRINGVNFKVIGVAAPKGGAMGAFFDDMIYLPITTMQKLLAKSEYLSSILIKVEEKNLIPQVQEEVISILAQKHRVDPENPDFSVISQEDILGALNQITNTMTIFLASIAAISLIVGGIGIMNMMLTSVTERTREIGLRKAIGAKKSDITLQFLSEAVALTFLGGIIGIILGGILAWGISIFAGISTKVSLFSILLAFGVSALIGIGFGYWPAQKAANLNPIEALRYE
jgi:putative ABC transport system permease protein